MILLKSENRTSAAVAAIPDCCEMAVNNWQKRYEKEGIKGLETRPGRGRPPILSQQNPEHLRKVQKEIKRHPNSVKTAVALLAEDLDLQMHPETLKRFLKKMVTDPVAHERGTNQDRWKNVSLPSAATGSRVKISIWRNIASLIFVFLACCGSLFPNFDFYKPDVDRSATVFRHFITKKRFSEKFY